MRPARRRPRPSRCRGRGRSGRPAGRSRPGWPPAVWRSWSARRAGSGLRTGTETPLPPQNVGGGQQRVRTRFRLQPTPDQEQALSKHRMRARFVWSLAVERHRHWRPGRAGAPAENIAAGRAVTARGGLPLGGPVNREPQLALSFA
ncbi:helix-turn-helix domain-containing protein [Actinoallomurus bryophytorum]|uniref:helix-turn-helix domain-containing protein n=1 Tax=Actinoallomurus bryophytorum TaxID=1490222 RepID=UPI0011536A2A